MELRNISLTFCFFGLALFLRMGTQGSASISGRMLSYSATNQTYPQDQGFLTVHNAARKEVDVQPMTWNYTVAAYAESYAYQRSTDCSLVHSGGPYGENLAWSSGNLSVSEAVKMWIDEKSNYDLKSGMCASGQVCGHYTQVIWANSIRLGCAKVGCDNGGTFIVCNYDPPGELPTVANQSESSYVTLVDAPSLSSAANVVPVVVASSSPSSAANGVQVVVAAPAPSPSSSTNGVQVGVAAPSPSSAANVIPMVVIVGACALILGLGFIWFILSRRKKQEDKIDDHISDVFFGGEFQNGMAPRKFSLVELAKVTSNFNAEKLGEGGFGAVYKGYLRDLDAYVAVKRISKASKQGIKEYASEVKIISRLRHKNLVKLIGWCHEKGELILVYEFMANGSLDSHLFKGKSLLTWVVRFKIVQDLSSALFYLHEEGDHCVLHRDIKTSNIMLDSSFNAKLGDFGLARLVDHSKGSQTTHLAGTLGYMAPECVSSGKASKKSDVYSFGIVALELACGRRSIEPKYEESQASLVAWVWDSYGNQRLPDVADQKLCLDFDAKQMECLLMVGLWCVHPDPNLRPSIRQAIQVLNFEAPLPKLPCTRPTPTYDVPMASGNRASEPCFSTLGITVPR